MSRFAWMFRAGRQQADLAREMDAHLGERIDELIEHGLSEAEARMQARRDFGNMTRQREESREVWQWRLLETARASVGDALRLFRRNAGTTVMCLFVLGASTGLFVAPAVVADQLVMRPIRLPDIDRVVSIGGLAEPGPGWAWNDWWDQAASLEAFTRWQAGLTDLATGQGRFFVNTAYVDSAFPELFPVRPVQGRGLDARDFADSAWVPVVINETTWERRFNRDPDLVGGTVTLSGVPVTVVGILPAIGAFPHDVQMWVPRPAREMFAVARQTGGGTHARLVDGASIEDARRDIQVLGTRLNAEFTPKTGVNYFGTFTLTTVADWLARPVRVPVLALVVGALALLVMAAVNVAGLLFNLIVDRRQELAVRVSLGATRRRILGQVAFESVLMGCAAGLIGGAVGAVLLIVSRPLLVPFSPYLASVDAVRITASIGVAAGTILGLIVGLIPASISLAWRDWRLLPYRVATRGSRQGRPLRTATAILQMAAAMMLVTVAAAAVQTFRASNRVFLGFEPASVLAVRVMVTGGSAQSAVEAIVENAKAAGLIESHAIAQRLPVVDPGGMRYVGPQNTSPAKVLAVGPGFFRALGVSLLAGQDFGPGETGVVVISDTLARRLWPGQSAVGEMLDVAPNDRRLVVGIVGDIQEDVAGDEVLGGRAAFYTLLSDHATTDGGDPQTRSVVMRCAVNCDDLAGRLSAIIEAAGALPVEVIRLQAAIDQKIASSRLGSAIAVGGGILGLILALTSIYGVVRHLAGARSQEMTIRMALGATPLQARVTTVRYGATLLGVGVAIGACFAWGVLSAGGPLWHGSSPWDPTIYLVAGLTLAWGGSLAMLGPIVRLGQLNSRRLQSE